MPSKQNKILVVEDDVTMREIVVHKLMSAGFTVLEADNGRQALELWESKRPSLLLLDLMLPEVDGFEVLRRVRESKDAKLAATPVIVLSNIFNKEEVDRVRAMHIEDFLVKAYYTTEEILEHVREVLKKNA